MGNEIKIFRLVNDLTQDDLGNYLGIKRSFVSHIENGSCKCPAEKYSKLINNDMGWDVSMLLVDSINVTGKVPVSAPVKNTAALEAKIEMLEKQLAEEKSRSSEYWELLKEAIRKA